MVNWDAVGATGEVIGAFAVVTTLVYLLIQVRQHSRSINSITTQTNIAQFNELTMLLAVNPDLADVFSRGSQNPDDLNESESYSFTWFVRSLMNLYANLYDQYQQNACPEYLWERHAKELKANYDASPGFQLFRESDPGFEDLFEYIDRMDAVEEYGATTAFHNINKAP